MMSKKGVMEILEFRHDGDANIGLLMARKDGRYIITVDAPNAEAYALYRWKWLAKIRYKTLEVLLFQERKL